MATLYRCPMPTDRLCACGKVARLLRRAEVDFEEVRVSFSRGERPEVAELTDQRWVPVLVHGDEVICDSARIAEYLDHIGRSEERHGLAEAAR